MICRHDHKAEWSGLVERHPKLSQRAVAIEQRFFSAERVAGQSHFRGARTGGTPVHLVRRRAPDRVAVAHREIVTRHVRCSVSRESDQ